jgi:hypothetical protein
MNEKWPPRPTLGDPQPSPVEPGQVVPIYQTERDLKAFLAQEWERTGQLPEMVCVSRDALFTELTLRRLGARRFLGLYWRAGSWPMTKAQIWAEARRTVPVSSAGEILYTSDYGNVFLRPIP